MDPRSPEHRRDARPTSLQPRAGGAAGTVGGASVITASAYQNHNRPTSDR